MAKALKIVGAVVIGVGLIVATAGVATFGIAGALSTTLAGAVSASTLLAAGALITAASSALTKSPSVPSSQIDRLTASIVPRAPRTTVLSETAMATDIRYQEWFGNEQEYCGVIIAVASHKVQSVDSIWINDKLAWAANSGIQPDYVGYFYVQYICLEGTPDNTTIISTPNAGIWNTSHRLTGCAYVQIQFRVTGVNSKASSPFSSGIPSRMTIIGKGAMLYDPRRDSTVPGGSGPMRIDDQSTWRYVADDGAVIGRNTALHILRILIGWKIRNPVTGTWKLATGSGVPARRIDLQSFIVAANLCDELVNRSAGGTEPRYETFAVVSEADEPKTTLDMLCAACSGRFRDTGGKLAFVIMHNDLADAATDDGLNDDDVMGAFTWNPDPSLEQTPNLAMGSYTDPSDASLYQLIPYPDVKIDSLDGIDRILKMDVAAIESPSQGQRVVKQALQRKQYDRSFTAPFDIRAWKYPVGRLVPFTFAALGFQRRLFRVSEQEPGGETGLCNMTLQEENAQIYAWDADDSAPVLAAEVIKYDSANNPLILAIGEAATSALWTNVVDNDPVGHPRPEDGATVGAPGTSPVGDSNAAQVVSDISSNALGLISQALRQDQAQTILEAAAYVAGQPVSVQFTNFVNAQTSYNTALQTTVALIGAKTADGSAFEFNLASVQVGGGITLAENLTQLGAATAAVNASLTEVKSAVLNADGTAKVKYALSLDLNGKITGFENTITGEGSSFNILANHFSVVDPTDGTTQYTVFDITGGLVRMHNVEVDLLKVNTAVVPVLASASAAVGGSGAGNWTTVLSATLTLPAAGWVEAIGAANQGFTSVPLSWGFRLVINGTVAWAPNGSYPGDSVPIVGTAYCDAGVVTAQIQWAGANGMQLGARFLSLKGLTNTQ